MLWPTAATHSARRFGFCTYPPRERWVLMLWPTITTLQNVFRRTSLRVGNNITHLSRGGYEQKLKRLPLSAAPVGNNITDPPLTRWV
jgi:hypothetical protein